VKGIKITWLKSGRVLAVLFLCLVLTSLLLNCGRNVERSLDEVIPVNSIVFIRISSFNAANDFVNVVSGLNPERLIESASDLKENFGLFNKEESGLSLDKPIGIAGLPDKKIIIIMPVRDKGKAQDYLKKQNAKKDEGIYLIESKHMWLGIRDNYLFISDSKPALDAHLSAPFPTEFKKLNPKVFEELKKSPEFFVSADLSKIKAEELEQLPFKAKNLIGLIDRSKEDFATFRLEVEASPLVNQYTNGAQIEWDISSLMPASPLLALRIGLPSAIAENLLPLLASRLNKNIPIPAELFKDIEGIGIAILSPSKDKQQALSQASIDIALAFASGIKMSSISKLSNNPWMQQVALIVKLKKTDEIEKLLGDLQRLKLSVKDAYSMAVKLEGAPKDYPQGISFEYGGYKGIAYVKNGAVVIQGRDASRLEGMGSLPKPMSSSSIACGMLDFTPLRDMYSQVPTLGQVLSNIPWKRVSGKLTQNENVFVLTMSGEK